MPPEPTEQLDGRSVAPLDDGWAEAIGAEALAAALVTLADGGGAEAAAPLEAHQTSVQVCVPSPRQRRSNPRAPSCCWQRSTAW